MISKKIKIQEYTSLSIQDKSTRSSPKKLVKSSNTYSDLNVNFLKLSVAMVKANTTRSASLKNFVYDTFLSALSLNGLVENKGSKLALRDGFRNKYRDFSKTSRTGELAQAINYIFAQEKLGYKFVLDYEEFISATKTPTKKTGAAPDYVLFGKNSKNLAVLESKGSSASAKLPLATIRSRLFSAMNSQCGDGVRHLQKNGHLVSHSYASLVELVESSDVGESIIHFADPDYDEFDNVDYSKAVKSHYSRWLSFIGILGSDLVANPNEFENIEVNGEQFVVQRTSNVDRYLNVPIRYGVSEKVLSMYKTGSFKDIYAMNTEVYSSDNVEIFSDGTIALEIIKT